MCYSLGMVPWEVYILCSSYDDLRNAYILRMLLSSESWLSFQLSADVPLEASGDGSGTWIPAMHAAGLD